MKSLEQNLKEKIVKEEHPEPKVSTSACYKCGTKPFMHGVFREGKLVSVCKLH